MKIIVISTPGIIIEEGRIITRLFDEGMEYFHVRKPDLPLEAIAVILKNVPIKYHDRIAFHQHHEWAVKEGYSRIHLPEYIRLRTPEKSMEEYKARKLTISTSVHDMEKAMLLSQHFSYTFIGPVFPSISKPGYASPKKLLDEDLSRVKTPLVALGGICAENIPLLASKGFAGVALLGSIWNSDQGVENFRKCKEAIKNLT